MVELLALVYRSVDWGKQGGKSVLDRWAGMILVASRAATTGEFVASLCARLGVGSVHGQVDALAALLRACRAEDEALLGWVAAEHLPVASLAYGRAREMRG